VIQDRPELVKGFSGEQNKPRLGRPDLSVFDCDKPADRQVILNPILYPDGVGFSLTEGVNFPFQVVDMGYGPL
jgi:hypothetical protein